VRILITGAGGMLATDVCAVLSEHDVTAVTRAQLDIENVGAVSAAVAGHDVVVNTAAYTKVDDAESQEEVAFRVNALGAQNVARACRTAGARLIHISTDYVFSGTASTPYSEDTPRAPVSAYGRTKAAGEELVLAEHGDGAAIVRTAWLYGVHGPNFVDTMLRLARERETIQVVDDQQGQPTWSFDLARQISMLIDAGVPAGYFHGTNAGDTTWFGLARRVFELRGLDPERIQPTDSSSFVRPAPRPAYSVLGHAAWTRAGIEPMRDWDLALEERLSLG